MKINIVRSSEVLGLQPRTSSLITMQSLLFERVLKEIKLQRKTFALILKRYFEVYLNDDVHLLSNNFIEELVETIVKDLLKIDKEFANDEGFVLIPDEGSQLRRGAEYFKIRAFLDAVVENCSSLASKMTNIPAEELQTFEKTFIQTFSDESSNMAWKSEFTQFLTDEIAVSKPFYIKIVN